MKAKAKGNHSIVIIAPDQYPLFTTQKSIYPPPSKHIQTSTEIPPPSGPLSIPLHLPPSDNAILPPHHLPHPPLIPPLPPRPLRLHPRILHRHPPLPPLLHPLPLSLPHHPAPNTLLHHRLPKQAVPHRPAMHPQLLARRAHAVVLAFELELGAAPELGLVQLPGAVDGPVAEGAEAGEA